MNVVVTGSRKWPDLGKVWWVLDRLAAQAAADDSVLHVCHGGARGADAQAQQWLDIHPQVGRQVFPAKWSQYQRSDGQKNPAGAIRNRAMLRWAVEHTDDFGLPYLVAFPLGLRKESPGTYDCIEAASELGVTVIYVAGTDGWRPPASNWVLMGGDGS